MVFVGVVLVLPDFSGVSPASILSVMSRPDATRPYRERPALWRPRSARGAPYAVALILVALVVGQCASSRGRSLHREPAVSGSGARIVATARRYVGVPYRYGGRTPRSGFDCSGFTKYVFGRHGLRLPVGARNQYRHLRPVRVPRPGDLVFFRTRGSQVSHVGIYVGGYRFLHAPRSGSRVGYADMRLRYWRKRYAGSRAVLR